MSAWNANGAQQGLQKPCFYLPVVLVVSAAAVVFWAWAPSTTPDSLWTPQISTSSRPAQVPKSARSAFTHRTPNVPVNLATAVPNARLASSRQFEDPEVLSNAAQSLQQSNLMPASLVALLLASAAGAFGLALQWSRRHYASRAWLNVEPSSLALMAASGENKKESPYATLERPKAAQPKAEPPVPEPEPSVQIVQVATEEEKEAEPVVIEVPPPAPVAPADDKPDVFKVLESSPFRFGLQLGWEARNRMRRLVSGFSRPTVRDFSGDEGDDFQAGRNCTVLVFGAQTPMGKILVRKLLLRGYTTRILLLPEWENSPLDLPDSKLVQKVTVDMKDHKALVKAMEGVGKVIYCASTSSTDIDLQTRLLIDDSGISSICRAAQDVRNAVVAGRGMAEPGKSVVTTPAKQTVAKMKTLESWGDVKITQKEVAILPAKWASLQYDGTASFTPSLSEEGGSKSAIFSGEFQANRDAVAEVALPLAGDDLEKLLSSEVLLLKAKGDNNRYSLTLEVDGVSYSTAFLAPKQWQSIRIPLEAFVNANGQALPSKANSPQARLILGFRTARALTAVTTTGRINFRLEMQFMKAVPSGTEPDIVLVSLSSSSLLAGGAGPDASTVQLRGEGELRKAGLCYTIIRPSQMLDTPSGGKPLLFDQARRGATPVSVADVADLCVKVLHSSAACNKAFDVSSADGGADNSLYAALTAPVNNTPRLVEVLNALDKHI